MLITHFNKLIRNKIVWGAFAFIVVIAFVGTGMSFRGLDKASRERNAEGKLFGQPVSSADFFKARYFAMGLRPRAENAPGS